MEPYDLDLQSIQEARTLARAGKIAQRELAKMDECDIEKMICQMVKVAKEHAEELAVMANRETGFGKVEDKITKNLLASIDLYEDIKDMKTVGIIHNDPMKKIIEIAEPVGLLMGIIPSTNPTSTTIFKSIIAIKSRNGIVFTPHPSAANCTIKAAQLMHDAAVSAGAPPNIISVLKKGSIAATNELMKCEEISLIIATGGSAMVKAAYSAGKPALGVGPGNVPAYIEKTADIPKAIANIIKSKTFDNGTICASEQSIIVEKCIRSQVIDEFTKQGAYFMNAEETKKVSALIFKQNFAMNAKLVGRDAFTVAQAAGIQVKPNTSVLIGEQKGVGPDYPLSYEKLTSVLGFYTVNDWHEACELSFCLLKNGGIGHTFSIHTEDEEMVMRFAEKPVFRILVNTGSSQGGVGASTGLVKSFTLGCGTWGGSATSDNVTPMHLINIKRIAYGIKDLVPSMPAIKNQTREDELSKMLQELLSVLQGGVKP